jgi:hypothetical protein
MDEPTGRGGHPGDGSLVEGEGVNADSSAIDPAARGADVRSGGRPADSGQMDEPTEGEELTGPPDQQGPRSGPGQELSAGEG